MEVKRYLESMSEPNDTMFIEFSDMYRFTRRGQDWEKFRQDIIEVLEQTVSEELSKEFAESTEDWVSEDTPE